MTKPGRPTKLNAATAGQLVTLTRGGLTLQGAAALAGVAERTVYRWLERGRLSGRRHAQHRALRAAILQARAERESDLVASTVRAAARGNWRAAAWLLEQQYPDRWGPPNARTDAAVQARTMTPLRG
jgi:hypothetical protein